LRVFGGKGEELLPSAITSSLAAVRRDGYNPGMASVSSPPLRVTVLGSGTSSGVPVIGCHCDVCHSSDPRNKRLRPSILVTVLGGEFAGTNLLVDTTPEMRLQVLRAGVEHLGAVLVTHPHADHIFGMDDIRQFNFRQEKRMPIYGMPPTLDHIHKVYDYCFTQTQEGGGKPQLDLIPFAPYDPFDLCGVTITPLTVLHGEMPVIAFKFGERFAYVTDVSRIPNETRPHLRNLDTLILGTVRYDPHPTHFGLWQAVEEAQSFAPRRTYFTHLSHYFEHTRTSAELPDGIALAYDGLTFVVP
jgi:phosphoribosyl 1,2-cyclic phosphate phosphodiesterase